MNDANDTKDNRYFVTIYDDILVEDREKNKSEQVGYLSSLLQKCFRRGPHNSKLIKKTLQKLNKSPSYNLPDHNFATVSGARQLLWRTFISVVEDVKGYVVNEYTPKSIDMLTLVLLAITCHRDPTLSITDKALEIIIETALNLQAYSEHWDWRRYPENTTKTDGIKTILSSADPKISQISAALKLSLDLMPMMSNDRTMLCKAINYVIDKDNVIDELSVIREKNIVISKSDSRLTKTIISETVCSGMDMHCKPTILIILQSMINYSDIIDREDFVKYVPSLETLAHYMWNNFSSKNYRQNVNYSLLYDDNTIKKLKLNKLLVKKLDNILYACIPELQMRLTDINDIGRSNEIDDEIVAVTGTIDKCTKTNWIKPSKLTTTTSTKRDGMDKVGRIAWLSVFGRRYRFSYKNKMYDVFLGVETSEKILKVKTGTEGKTEYVEGELRDSIQERFFVSFSQDVDKPSPPDGYRWKIDSSSIRISYDVDKKVFMIDDIIVDTLNLSNMLEPVQGCTETEGVPEELSNIVKVCTYSSNSCDDWFGEGLIFRCIDIYNERRSRSDYRVFRWDDLVKRSVNQQMLWRIVAARIYTSDVGGTMGQFILSVGPCDRHGKKTSNSIGYQFEGTLYRIFIMLSVLYPYTLKKRASMRWVVDKTRPEYQHMMQSINRLCFDNSTSSASDVEPYKDDVKIITTLWEHQESTSQRIFRGMSVDKRRGFGDASHVGAGKTLCTLSLFNKLYNYDKQNYVTVTSSSITHSGYLVMLPTAKLIKTWKDEIDKHTKGFDLYVQQPDGDVYFADRIIDLDSVKIHTNTVFITTMGRIRDHPLYHSWSLVVIDECLSVQNKEALQTEEAWRQCCYSKYGVLMLSATFFRSRFDKMLYMIKMLKTGLPEERDYLDAILNESIMSNVTESNRTWKIVTEKVPLNKENRKKYDSIYKANTKNSSETLYRALCKFINDNIDYVDIFYDQIDDLERSGRKVLIFTNSKKEADSIVDSNRNNYRITRYPDKSGTHTVLSFSEGTYGLNVLVIYDTILMRPPEPDSLPQIKGRLDRPGQKCKDLWIRYIILKDTIEEATLLRLEICNSFYNNYLMPLAEFYDLAVDRADANILRGVTTKIIKKSVPKKSSKKEGSDKMVKVVGKKR